MSGISIRLFLVDGTPDGLQLAEKSNWSGLGIVCSRAQYPQARDRPEFARPGVYLLLGPSEDDPSTTRLYIGESDALRGRLDNHARNKDFWTRVVAFTSKDDNLNKAHVRYLESRLIQLAHAADRAEVENGNVTQAASLSESDRADAEGFLEQMLVLLPILQVDAFVTPASSPPDERTLRVTGPQADATGEETPAGFVVLAGSRARVEEMPSIHQYMVTLRAKLLAEGVLVPDDNTASLRFTKDYLFGSPSTAAGVVLGRPANGRIEWKDAAGRSLRDLDREALG